MKFIILVIALALAGCGWQIEKYAKPNMTEAARADDAEYCKAYSLAMRPTPLIAGGGLEQRMALFKVCMMDRGYISI